MNFILSGIIAFITLFVPGILIAISLLKGTKLRVFEILVIGFIFGLIAPATLTWIEAYAMTYIHFFAFSLGLFEVNAIIISIIFGIYAYKTGAIEEFMGKLGINAISRSDQAKNEIKEIKSEEHQSRDTLTFLRSKLSNFDKAKQIIERHQKEEADLRKKQNDELSLISNFTDDEKKKVVDLHKKDELVLIEHHQKEERMLLDKLERQKVSKPINISSVPQWVWFVLFAIMLLTFATRMLSIGITPNFFEFDPYFDMLSTQQLLTYGYMPLLSTSAWPALASGSVMRIQPLIPYLEAYWYSLMNGASAPFNTTLMSFVSGVYPPITAALLVFVVFMLLYTEYDEYVGLIGAALAAAMPVLLTTFISGEQLLEPWGIFSLFFFFAMYMLAVKDMKNKRLAILAGIAFASTFLGAHYFTVDAGVLTLYIIFQGIISYLRKDLNIDFYKMNAIVIIVIAVFLVFYQPYNATLNGRIPAILGIPITVSGPLFALIFIAILNYLPKELHKRKIAFKNDTNMTRMIWTAAIIIIAISAIALTPLGDTVKSYLSLSTKFTTPSTPLFMTVQEFMPTGLTYDFGSAGFGVIGSSLFGIPLYIYIVMIIAYVLIILSIIFRKSNIGILYLWITLPLAVAAFSEVKYLPHFGVAYILLIGIIIGELLAIIGNKFDFHMYENRDNMKLYIKNAYQNNKDLAYVIFSIALFFVMPIIAVVFLLIIILTKSANNNNYMYGLIALFFISIIILYAIKGPVNGEMGSIVDSFSAATVYSANPSTACTTISNQNNAVGYDLYCNIVPQYWINAASWMRQNVGPNGPRILSWWDYGDWINWFGQSPAVIRGDNSVDKQDFATAANYVLGKNDNYSSKNLANFMNTNQTKYVVFDEALIQKWGALDFLACINVNATSKAFAIAQGQQQTPPAPYLLGQSQCELTHDPELVLIPLSVLAPTVSSPSISDYCSISNNSVQYAKGYLVVGDTVENQSVCVGTNPTVNGDVPLYTSNGTKMNAMVQLETLSPMGETSVGQAGSIYLEYLVIYTPNGPNNTITNAPSGFYDSNFYKGFFLGNLNGFTQVYPSNATGINFVNGTYPIRIFSLNNFTGTLPTPTAKPSYVVNNYTFPG